MTMKKIYILALVIGVASCTASKLTMPTQADADGAQRDFPGATLADISTGKGLYEQHCQSCHGLKTVTDYTVQAWHSIVPGMVEQANQKTPNSVSENDERLILMYVTSVRH
jgi:mono/diheme cytochrome c family protein